MDDFDEMSLELLQQAAAGLRDGSITLQVPAELSDNKEVQECRVRVNSGLPRK